jgi:amidophosphoribosyltransferase
MRISSPPTKWPCYYGIDTPERRELIGSSHSIDEIRDYIEADSLQYLDQDRMLAAVQRGGEDTARLYCTACFTGQSPLAEAAIEASMERAAPVDF